MENSSNGQSPAAAQEAVKQAVSQQIKVDDVVSAEVIKVAEFGAFVRFGSGKKGLIHISQVSDSYVKKVDEHLKVGDKVNAKIIKISPDGKIDLTLKSGNVKKDDSPRSFNGARPTVGGRGQGERRFGRQDTNYRENMSSSPEGKAFKASPFEDKLKHFLKESDERQSDFKKHTEEKQRR